MSVAKTAYKYCEDCGVFFDFWKYDYNLEAAGHEDHIVRDITDEEYQKCLKDCREMGCFDEDLLRV